MKRNILIPLVGLSLFYNACRSPEVVPEPEEYFSFYADGVFYDYPQVMGWGGATRTLEAGKEGSTGYYIAGRLDDPPIGNVNISFSGAHVPDKGTIEVYSASVSDFSNEMYTYTLRPPLKGKVVFSERTETKLTGTFEFEAFRIAYDENGHVYYTDTIIKITKGKFSIKPKN